jgi:hypothetical protein
MLAALLLAAAAAPAGAEQAERSFAAMAQREGQWTAFRAFADRQAIMFTPGPGNAQAWLAGRADPPSPVMWWPARTFTACDGSLTISTGPWLRRGGGAHGTFTTVWRRQADGGWKWRLDHGRETPQATAAGENVQVSAPTCSRGERIPAHPPEGVHLKGALVDPGVMIAAFGAKDVLVQRDGAMPAESGAGLPRVKIGDPIAEGCSDDRSLCWDNVAIDGGETGAHDLIVYQRRGGAWKIVLYELVGVGGP